MQSHIDNSAQTIQMVHLKPIKCACTVCSGFFFQNAVYLFNQCGSAATN